jgi:DNA-binding XRE family transcriptional regulator
MPDATTALANRLREIRGDRSMAEMADLVGVSRQTWFKWENATGIPRDLDTLANSLGVGVSELFEVA